MLWKKDCYNLKKLDILYILFYFQVKVEEFDLSFCFCLGFGKLVGFFFYLFFIQLNFLNY